MINKENMKKPQRDLFDFLENIIGKKYNDLVLECFLKFKNKTVFEKTMKRILKGKDEFDCEEYELNLEQLEFIIAELQKLKKKNKKKIEKKTEKKEKKKGRAKKEKKELKKVGEECTKDEECKGKGCCDKGKCEKGNKKVCKNKGKKSHSKPQISKKKSHPLPPSLKKTPAPIIDEELYKDGEDCKIDDHCKSKCCKNNQCVSGSICKDEKKNKKIKKKLIKKDLEKKERLKKYELFEKKSIGYIKDLTGQINRRDEFGKPHRTKKQMMKAYRKLYGKIKDVFNDRFAGHSQGWIIDQIPIEIKRQLDFLKERIIMDKSPSIRNPTPMFYFSGQNL